ncbi:hypothetical protein [Peribacillus frigoritolerans]|uniref:hypothetical protein n=1 Tax=Peribacillus frigoritolerans TaxID=450367 RepID=UPI0022810585|nr:hypothetical protein [Peribacillus frigoritolerans]MCY9138375.1 hypothetical protein [Peribacillus frigoritolerans]
MSSSHNGKKAGECKTCGSHDSACKCQFKAPKRKTKPLNSDCIVVDSVICSKEVQKTAELDIGLGLFGIEDEIVDVTVDESNIDQNIVLIEGKVVNIGVVPINVTVAGTPFSLSGNVIFQEETDCPGACPGDTVTETPLQIEAIILQRVENAFLFNGLLTTPVLRVKVILRTTITVTRPVILDKDGNICDLNDRRCETPTPLTVQPPVLLGVPTSPDGIAASLMENEILKNLLSQKNDTN